MQMSRKKCEEWRQNKNKNPLTNRKIKTNGGVYKKIQKRCQDLRISGGTKSKKTLQELCEQFFDDDTINPKNNKKIKKYGKVYHLIQGDCEQFPRSQLNISDKIIDIVSISEDTVDKQCVNMFSGVDKYYKDFSKKMKKFCHSYIKQSQAECELSRRGFNFANYVRELNDFQDTIIRPNYFDDSDDDDDGEVDLSTISETESEQRYRITYSLEALQSLLNNSLSNNASQDTIDDIRSEINNLNAVLRSLDPLDRDEINETVERREWLIIRLEFIERVLDTALSNNEPQDTIDYIRDRIVDVNDLLRRLGRHDNQNGGNAMLMKLTLKPNNTLASFYKYYTSLRGTDKKNIFLRYETLNLNYKGQRGIGDGVKRNFLSSLATDIVKHKFFKQIEGSNRYFINADIKLSDSFLKDAGIAKTKVKVKEELPKLFEFIGKCMVMLLINDFPLEINLSRSILDLFLNDKPNSSQKLITYLLDYPEDAKSLINMMKDPDTIKYIGLEFNDQFPLVRSNKNEDITKKNFVKYLKLKSDYQIYGKISSDAKYHKIILKSLIKNGVHSLIPAINMKDKLNMSKLDSLIMGADLDDDKLKEFANRIKRDNPNLNATSKTHMYNILTDYNAEKFPFSEIGKDKKELSKKQQKEVYYEFIGKLIYFWTSLKKIKTDKNYQVVLSNMYLPQASTCFYQLKIPKRYKIIGERTNSEKELYRRLVVAVYGVEEGVGLLGGGRKKKRVSKKKKRVVKKKKVVVKKKKRVVKKKK